MRQVVAQQQAPYLIEVTAGSPPEVMQKHLGTVLKGNQRAGDRRGAEGRTHSYDCVCVSAPTSLHTYTCSARTVKQMLGQMSVEEI